MDTSSGDQRQLEIEVGENAEGRFSNLVMVTHTPSEVILDFAVMMPGMQKPRVVSRVVLTPEHAKRFLAALVENLKRYEKRFGPITPPGSGQPPQPSA